MTPTRASVAVVLVRSEGELLAMTSLPQLANELDDSRLIGEDWHVLAIVKVYKIAFLTVRTRSRAKRCRLHRNASRTLSTAYPKADRGIHTSTHGERTIGGIANASHAERLTECPLPADAKHVSILCRPHWKRLDHGTINSPLRRLVVYR